MEDLFDTGVRIMLSFYKEHTPGGSEYARRMHKGIAAIYKGDRDQARKWINLCCVYQEQG